VIKTMKNSSNSQYRGRSKYNESTARSYEEQRPDAKHAAEMRLIDRALAYIPTSHRVLDAPCGGGRVTAHLARKNYAVSAADLSESMLEIARANLAAQGLACKVEKQDLEQMTLPDRSFDTVLSFRLFHHFPEPGIRQKVISELCRVADRYVVLSYFSPFSVTSFKRRLRELRGGRKSEKYSTSLREIDLYFQQAGFRLVKDFARFPLLHTLHLAIFERIDTDRSGSATAQ
jgi:ubiquinone/menaquinone biosynthesis C-methylase UbiE